MKARVWAFMMDLSRYEAGMDDFSVLATEIVSYMKKSLLATKDYGDVEDILCEFCMCDNTLQLHISVLKSGQKECIMKKDILFVYNKSDAINDIDIVDELLTFSYENIASYMKHDY